ncbi:hypothetical protein PFISCL1PPCAC_17991, partial [Pristionchus fissidentatus]
TVYSLLSAPHSLVAHWLNCCTNPDGSSMGSSTAPGELFFPLATSTPKKREKEDRASIFEEVSFSVRIESDSSNELEIAICEEKVSENDDDQFLSLNQPTSMNESADTVYSLMEVSFLVRFDYISDSEEEEAEGDDEQLDSFDSDATTPY